MSLKRQPSEEPEESPKSKRQECETTAQPDTATTPVRPHKLGNQNESSGSLPAGSTSDKGEEGETVREDTTAAEGKETSGNAGEDVEERTEDKNQSQDRSEAGKLAEEKSVDTPLDDKLREDKPEEVKSGGDKKEEEGKKEDSSKEEKESDAKGEEKKGEKKTGFLGAPVNNGNSIWSSGFSLSSSNYTNGSSSGSSSNIFAAAMSSAGSRPIGLFGAAPSPSSSSSSATPSSGGFFFGANLGDRVVAPAKKIEDEKKVEGGEKKEEADSEKKEAESTTPKKAEEDKISLVEVSTGEEGEKRVLQTSCKLYQFCPTAKTWVDRGGGVLRLNEKEDASGRVTSRLVFRSKAVMKVMLNTQIFADMFINRANLTTIRISALEAGRIGTFLLKCTRNECDRLHTALLKRRETEKQNQEPAEDSKTGSDAKNSTVDPEDAAVAQAVSS